MSAFSDIITFTRASAAWRFNSAGVLEQVPANQPRFDYDPVTRALKGLLVEEQRTNLILQSSDFNSAAWIRAAGITFSTDGTLAPDGSLMQLATLSGTNNHNINQTLSAALTVGTTYTLTVFVRAKGALFPFQLAYYDGSTALNGVLITPDTIGATQRLSFTFTPSVAATTPQVRLVGFGQGGDGSQIYMWGGQLEVGAFPTSYIPTTSAQVTRAADVASVNTLSPWFNPDEGTLFVEASSPALMDGVGRRAASLFQDNTNYMSLNRTNTGLISTDVVTGGSGQFTSLAAAVANNAIFRVALAYATNDTINAVNGAVSSPDTAVVLPAPRSLQIGQRGANQGIWNGHIRRIRYWPRRLFDNELQRITA